MLAALLTAVSAARPASWRRLGTLRGGGSGDDEGLPLAPPPPMDYSAASFGAPVEVKGEDSLPPGVPTALVCDAMVAEAVAWASCNGLLMRTSAEEPSGAFEHAPFSLLPAEFPAEQLELAAQLSPLFGTLVDRIAADVPWLTRTLQGTADSDDFTRRLLKLCARVQREGATQKASLAILRSDYMLHDADDGGGARLLQVELNTIAASFGCLSTRVSELHTHRSRWKKRAVLPVLTTRRRLPAMCLLGLGPLQCPPSSLEACGVLSSSLQAAPKLRSLRFPTARHLAQQFAPLRHQLWLRAGQPSSLTLVAAVAVAAVGLALFAAQIPRALLRASK